MKRITLCMKPQKLSLVALLIALLVAMGSAAVTAQDLDEFAGSAFAAAPRQPTALAAPPSALPIAVDGLTQSAPSMKTAATGLSFGGYVSGTFENGGLRLRAERIVNSRSSGTSGTLRVALWATPTVPVFGNTINAYTLGNFTLSPLSAGFEYDNVDQTVTQTLPPAGCYYLTLALQEYDSGTYYYQDLVTFTTGGVPDGSGYHRFSFGGANCSGSSVCVQDSTTACILNGRFRATVRVRGAFDNLPADKAAFRKPVTGFSNPNFETAFFYFNSPDNIEILLKMLDQGNTDSQGHPTLAVLFGSATPLRVELTITDTTNGAVRTYLSPFGSQQGSSDFTAFIK